MQDNKHHARRQLSRERLRAISDMLRIGESELAADILIESFLIEVCEVCGDRPAVRRAPDFTYETWKDADGQRYKRVDGTINCCAGCAEEQEGEAWRLEYEQGEIESERRRWDHVN